MVDDRWWVGSFVSIGRRVCPWYCSVAVVFGMTPTNPFGKHGFNVGIRRNGLPSGLIW